MTGRPPWGVAVQGSSNMTVRYNAPMHSDASNGWDPVSEAFIALRRRSYAGADQVARWVASMPRGAAVLDVACGCGEPLTRVLVESGCGVFALDASPRMVEALRGALPEVRVACEPVECSSLFGRTYDGVLAWGLLFLLPEQSQEAILRKLAGAVSAGGSMLFTSPREAVCWPDATTGRPSISLGAERYAKIVNATGLSLVSMFHDADGNHYYRAERAARDRRSSLFLSGEAA